MKEKRYKYNEDTPQFFCCQALYDLWLNRDEDKPVTTRELFKVVEHIAEKISHAETSAVWSNWDGHV